MNTNNIYQKLKNVLKVITIEMINYYTNENNLNQSASEIEIDITESQDNNSENLNNNNFPSDTNLNISRFSLDTEDIRPVKNYKIYYVIGISSMLITGSIITVVTTLLTK